MASKQSLVDVLYLFLIFLLIFQELHRRIDLVNALGRLSMSLFYFRRTPTHQFRVVEISREVMRFQILL